MSAFLGLEWSDVIEALIRVIGVLPMILIGALGVGFGIWLIRRDPVIKTQAETINKSAEVVLKHTSAVEKYNQQVLDLQNNLDKANDTHTQALRKQHQTHQEAIDQLTNELVRIKQAAKTEREDRAKRERELQGEIDRLTRELSDARAQVTDLASQLAAATEAATLLKTEVGQLREKQQQDQALISSLQSQIEDYCATIGRLEVELGRLRNELAEAQAAKAAAEAKLEEERRQMQEQIEQLRTRLDKTETAEFSADQSLVSSPSSDGSKPETKEVSDV